MVLDAIWREQRSQHQGGGGLQCLQELKKGFPDDVPAATAVFHHKEERPDMPE
jgi:hypothetical protein